MMKRKILILLMVICLPLIHVVRAEDYSDRDAWDAKCNGVSSPECDGYRAHLLEEKREKMNELKEQIDNLIKNIESNNVKLDEIDKILTELNKQISDLEAEQAELSDRIEELQKNIVANKTLVDEIEQRVLQRMRDAQGTMHFNQYLDFLLGSTSFDDLMRRSYGVKAINEKDEDDRNELIEIIEKLRKDEQELEEKQQELEEKQQELKESKQYQEELMIYYKQENDKNNAEIERLQNEYDSISKDYSNILNQIGDISNIPSSAGLYSPVPGASISAGTWYYPESFGGAVHLGVDYAVKVGTNIYAPANGVVILSADGCPTGYLGSGCGANIGGVYAGGNQVIMIVSAENVVYGVSFFHLQQGSPVGTGVISEGDYVGRVGSSGNSSGPHCHIELYYLGEGDMSDIQNDYLLRDYTLGFNCGWGGYGLNRLCENGVGAPCRLRPELYFGA